MVTRAIPRKFFRLRYPLELFKMMHWRHARKHGFGQGRRGIVICRGCGRTWTP